MYEKFRGALWGGETGMEIHRQNGVFCGWVWAALLVTGHVCLQGHPKT